jgi:hypothetical protein
LLNGVTTYNTIHTHPTCCHVPSVFCGMTHKFTRFVSRCNCRKLCYSSRWRVKSFAHGTMADEVNNVCQGVRLWMYGEVLRCLGSNTCIHIQTSPKMLAQWRDHIQHYPHTSHMMLLVCKTS